MSRHDYLPFGEELYAGSGGRTSAQGYQSSDGVREQFTGYERDTETGLDYAHARYYGSTQGRFTSPDPFGGSMTVTNPQSLNRYSYVTNNPLNAVDPSGLSGHAPMMSAPTSRYGVNITGSSLTELEEDEAAYEQSLAETYAAVDEAQFLNHAQATGAMSSEEAAVIAAGNPMLMANAWVTRIHNDIIDKAFPGLTDNQREMLKKASKKVDDDQKPEDSYKHAMRAPGQSKIGAALKAAFFITDAVLEARRLQEEYVSNGGTGFSDAALTAIGRAIHTLTDSTSPSHKGFQVWHGSDDVVNIIRAGRHIVREEYINPSQMKDAVNKAQSRLRLAPAQ